MNRLQILESKPTTEWVTQYAEDWSRIRTDPRARFRVDPWGIQQEFLWEIDGVYRQFRRRAYFYPFLKALLRSPLFLRFVREIKGELKSKSELALQRWAERDRDFRKLEGLLKQSAQFRGPEKLIPIIRKVGKPSAKEVNVLAGAIWRASHGLTILSSGAGGSHYTESRRQQDSNLHLANDLGFLRVVAKRPKNVLFAGGSLGLTATAFRKTMPDKIQQDLFVVCADLCDPQTIARSLGNQNTDFRGFLDIVYTRMDLQRMGFGEETFDLIDVCNCLGYLHKLNDRLDVMRDLWSMLKPGGYIRVSTPGPSSFLEQAMFIKTGSHLGDWDLRYVNLCGHTYSRLTGLLQDPATALKIGIKLTEKIKRVRKKWRKRNPLKSALSDEGKALVLDLKALNPVTLGAGVQTLLAAGIHRRVFSHRRGQKLVWKVLDEALR